MYEIFEQVSCKGWVREIQNNCQAAFVIMNLKWDWFHYVVGLPSSVLFGCVYADSKVAGFIPPEFWYLQINMKNRKTKEL